MPRPSVLYHVWKIRGQDGRCRYCKGPVHWVYLDTGKKLPLEPNARALREERTTSGARFLVYAGEASHLWHCPAKKDRSPVDGG